METNLDSVQRDKRQIETDRTNIYDELQKKFNKMFKKNKKN